MTELIILLMIILAATYVLTPLFLEETHEEPAEIITNRKQVQKEEVYSAIRELDSDFELGKLEEIDWKELRDGLLNEAISLQEESK